MASSTEGKQTGLVPALISLVIFIGLPGSGKSSFYRARFAATHRHLSKDNWPNARRREARLQRELRAALARNENVVLDNTHITRDSRALSLSLGREFEARITGYVFEPNLNECLARNAARPGKTRVPDVALFYMHHNWQEPLLEEGFDELFAVRLHNGDFEIAPSQPSTNGEGKVMQQ